MQFNNHYKKIFKMEIHYSQKTKQNKKKLDMNSWHISICLAWKKWTFETLMCNLD